MSTNTLSETGDPRWFIALMAPPEVEDYANTIIQQLSDRYRTRTSNSPPHITLQAPFLMRLEQSDTLVESLKIFAQHHVSIPIQLSGFGHFGKRVIFIDVLQNPELMTLQSALAQHLHLELGIIDPKAHFRSFTPHMTVASRRLTPKTFDQAWEELSQQSVSFQYWCDRITVLLYDSNQWNIHQHIELGQGIMV